MKQVTVAAWAAPQEDDSRGGIPLHPLTLYLRGTWPQDTILCPLSGDGVYMGSQGVGGSHMDCVTWCIWNQVIGDGHWHQHSIWDNAHLDGLHHQSQPGLAQG